MSRLIMFQRVLFLFVLYKAGRDMDGDPKLRGRGRITLLLLHLDQRLTRDRRHSSGICFSSYRGYKYILASHFLSILGELELEICDTYVQREIHILWYIQISEARCLRPHRVTEIETFGISFIISKKILQFC